jgi:hypothetical protein
MNWQQVMRWFIPPGHRPDPSAAIAETIQAQQHFNASAEVVKRVADGSRASIEETAAKAKQRVSARKPPDPRISAAREALKLLERTQ